MIVEWLEVRKEEFPNMDFFRIAHPYSEIVSVDGEPVVGECEICEQPVFESEPYTEDGETVSHLSCEIEEGGGTC